MRRRITAIVIALAALLGAAGAAGAAGATVTASAPATWYHA